jgi:hypothetical protein
MRFHEMEDITLPLFPPGELYACEKFPGRGLSIQVTPPRLPPVRAAFLPP